MYVHSEFPELSVTARKDWMTTMKSVVTTGESVTARRDGNQGRTGWQPNLHPLRGGTPSSYDELYGKIPPGVPKRGEDEHPSRTDTMLTDPGNGHTTMSTQCTCGKVCKNIRGLKIHQSRMKCLLGAEATQRTGVTLGETQEVPGLESPHSAQNLQVLQTNPSSIKSDRRWIKWPAASMTSLWKQFDDDVDQILEATAKGEADKKLQALTTIIVSIGAERFGEEEKSSVTT